jgi:DNA-nicking Smr family endonuclease
MSRKNKPDVHHPFAALQRVKDDLQAVVDAKAAEEKQKAAARAEQAKWLGLPQEKKKPAKAAPVEAKAPGKRSAVDVWRPDERQLFASAMSGVTPLTAKAPRVSASDPHGEVKPKRVPLETKLRRAAAEGGDALTVDWRDDGTVVGFRRGHEFALEALGRFALPAESCDLHRLEVVEASAKVQEFVRSRRARGVRCVSVICGRGKNSPGGASVLCDAVVKALAAPPTAHEVEAFRTAPDELGGAGALLVSLRS